MHQELPTLGGVQNAAQILKDVCRKTPLEHNERLSKMVGASVFLKREDLQQIRSFKIRGAYNKIASLSISERKRGVVCASAGNHVQDFALSCKQLANSEDYERLLDSMKKHNFKFEYLNQKQSLFQFLI
ncbi:MAG: threonine dehydratase [Flavobacteriaceae bacterium]|jgi:threonine dehydratase|tara:strand:- start:408 stop:794 length:387 start_codon:yes stop_codon:yes gene_type:complete